MNVVKCVNGHFFDFDKYDTCPHCGANVASAKDSERDSRQSRRDTRAGRGGSRRDTRGGRGFSGAARRDTRGGKAIASGDTLGGNGISYKDTRDGNGIVSGDTLGGRNRPENYNPGEPVRIVTEEEPDTRAMPDPAYSVSLTTASITMGDFLQDDPNDYLEELLKPEPSDVNGGVFPSGTLKQELASASASNEQRTLGYFNRLHSNVQDNIPAAEPTTGWLVCVGGPHFGESFPLVTGNNLIGRGDDNRVVLSRDRGVSKHKHAVIIFEPRKRKFYLQPGESSGLTYLDDSFITGVCELKPRSLVELGNSRLLFVPLCGDDFSWEKYMTDAEER